MSLCDKKWRKYLAALAGVVFLLALPVYAADRYYIGPATLQASSSVPQSVVDGVNPQGWVLYTQSFNIRELICEVFLAKTVEGKNATATRGNLLYSGIVEGAFIGVIHLLPEATEDYSADANNQKLKPGYYTMRYAVLPAGTYEHGTKLGDFVVLSPASMDTSPMGVLKAEDLRRLGAATSGSNVAASIELVAADAGVQKFPVAKMDDAATCIFQVQLHVTSAKGKTSRDLPMAISLLTPLHGPEGS